MQLPCDRAGGRLEPERRGLPKPGRLKPKVMKTSVRALCVLGLAVILGGGLFACRPGSPAAGREQVFEKGTFGYDLRFLEQYHDDLLVLKESDSGAQVIIAPGYQARVMTSTAAGHAGRSFGWINYEEIASNTIRPHMNAYGGEERFWLGPEGGQYALYFKPGDPFDFDHWQTPGLIDTADFPLVSSSGHSAVFEKQAGLRNYAGTEFNFLIQREISLLDEERLETELGGISLPSGLKWVAYETGNTLKNTGDRSWEKEKGLLSIWLLGMFNPSPKTVVMIPLKAGGNKEELITDDYFGEIPAERLEIRDSVLLFAADGNHRSKLGVDPGIAMPLAGSFDFENNVLTLIRFDLDPEGDYVDSKWETQPEPYEGDAVNAYNDGPLEDGSQMGPFYELESSSSVKELAPGGEMRHRQVTMHFEGGYEVLNELAAELFGISLDEVKPFVK